MVTNKTIQFLKANDECNALGGEIASEELKERLISNLFKANKLKNKFTMLYILFCTFYFNDENQCSQLKYKENDQL